MEFSEKVEKLPGEIKAFFTSNEDRYEFEKAFFVYGLDVSGLAKISKESGLIFVGDFPLSELPHIILKIVTPDQKIAYGLAYEINKRTFGKFPDYFKDSQTLLQQWGSLKSNPVVSEEEAYAQLVKLEPWILEVKKEEPIKRVVKTISLPISQALKQYSQLGEQLISSGGIKMKYFNAPVRPSIKNWIADYNEVMGVEKHDMMRRGDYLFHSENGKRLTTGERQKVSDVLKSLDEGSMLSVDSQRQEVVFNTSENTNGPSNANQATVTRYQTSGFNVQSINNQPPAPAKPANNVNRTENRISAPSVNPSEKPLANPFLNQKTETKTNDFFNAQNFVNQNGQQSQSSKPAVGNPQPEKKVDFSSPHKFPSEINSNNVQKNILKKEIPKARSEEKYPYIINPHKDYPGSSEPKISGNVVDLRN